MSSQVDLDILNLDWLNKVVGAHLYQENLIQEIVAFLKKRIPAKKVTLFLWDDAKKKFFLQGTHEQEKNYIEDRQLHRQLHNALMHHEPSFPYKGVLIPLFINERYIGVIQFEHLTFGTNPLQFKNEIMLLAKIVRIVLSNANFFIEFENLSKDMFKFNVLNRALNPTIEEDTAARILADGISRITSFDIFTLLMLGKQGQRIYIRSKKPFTPAVIRKVRSNLTELVVNLTHLHLDMNVIQEKIEVPKGKPVSTPIISYLNVPLITKDKIIGVISLGSTKRDGFATRDHQNVQLLASHAASALENIILYRDLHKTYFSIVKALTQAIEAKDPYTRGHSVLVSKFAVCIAKAMGLSSSMIESIQIAGLLHDLGKIGVPEEILLKNGKLTHGEYEVVKAHSEIALKILGAVEFPHFFKGEKNGDRDVLPELTLSLFEPADLSADIKLMIFHHHEKYGGGGYPQGIKKDEIPLGARILSVADTFEALTADRPYRRAFSVSKARAIIQEASGEQLDPSIVRVFLGILNNRWFHTIKAEV